MKYKIYPFTLFSQCGGHNCFQTSGWEGRRMSHKSRLWATEKSQFMPTESFEPEPERFQCRGCMQTGFSLFDQSSERIIQANHSRQDRFYHLCARNVSGGSEGKVCEKAR